MPGAMDDRGSAGECRGVSSPAGRHRPGDRELPPRPGPEPPGRGGPLPGDLPRASPRPPYLQTLAARRAVALCDGGPRRGAAHAPAPDPDGQGDSGGLAPGTGDGGQWAWETHVGTGARSSAPTHREAIELVKLEGLSTEAAAARAGTTPGAFRVRAHRASRALRQLLGS